LCPRREFSRCGIFVFGAREYRIQLEGGVQMARPEKEESVAEMKERLQNCSVAIASQYQGITVEQVTQLRSKMRAQKVHFKVYKNTLATRALKELNLEEAAKYMDGPTIWAFSKDPVAPAKILKEFSKDVDKVKVNGGILDGKPVDAAMLEKLADLPSREQLLGQLVGVLAAPLQNFVGVMSAVPRNFVGVLASLQRKKEEGGAAA
jgi:large subunit ribosomal protein L10